MAVHKEVRKFGFYTLTTQIGIESLHLCRHLGIVVTQSLVTTLDLTRGNVADNVTWDDLSKLLASAQQAHDAGDMEHIEALEGELSAAVDRVNASRAQKIAADERKAAEQQRRAAEEKAKQEQQRAEQDKQKQQNQQKKD